MIITRNECKSLLQDSTIDDNLIDSLIPIIEQVICDYCNNDFILKHFDYISSNDFTFTNSDHSINLTGLENSKLVAGDDIRVYGSLRNDGVYTVSSVTTDKIIVDSINTITDEDESESIILTKVKYPISFKFIAAQMIKYNIDSKKVTGGLSEEQIDDYRYKLSVAANSYPSHLVGGLQSYRSLYKFDVFSRLRG